MEENKYSELLTYYLDGELDPMHEQELLSELAVNTELEAELTDMLAIRSSVRAEINAECVPADATHAIFSAIGIGSATTTGTITGSATQASFYSNRVIRYASVLLLVGAIVYLFFNITDKESKIENLQNQLSYLSGQISEKAGKPVKESTPSVDENSSKYEYPVITSSEVDNRQKNNLKVNTFSIKPIETKNNNDNTQQKTAVSANSIEFLPEVSEAKIALHSKEFSNRNLSDMPGNNVFPATTHGLTITNLSNNTGDYMISLRGVNPNSFPAPKFSITMPVFSNIGIGIYRSFRGLAGEDGFVEDVKIGFEFGQEPFSQEFYVNKQGQTNIRKQNPLLFWCTAACRVDFTPNIVFNELQPYSQIEIGGTQIGPIIKLQTGLNLDITGGLGVQAGIEGSSLLFNNQTKWYSSEKLSIFYGMTIKF